MKARNGGRFRIKTAQWKRADGPARTVDGEARPVGCIRSDGGSKARYFARSVAKNVAKGIAQRSGEHLRAYRCPNCAGYHLARDYRTF